jgi:cell division protease FtsH
LVRPSLKNLLLVIATFGVVAWLALSMAARQAGQSSATVSYSQFLADAKSGRVKSAVVGTSSLEARYADGKSARVATVNDPYMVSDLIKYNVDVSSPGASSDSGSSSLWQMFIAFGPVLLIIGLWLFFMKQQSGKGGQMGFGRSKAKLQSAGDTEGVSFADVAGCDEAKEEVREVVEFLANPAKFQKLGGRAPKGILLSGPPGTGKTLLAKAIAGEAKVPFFLISGSDFVEMFVGVGASRVRDLFEKAKAAAPCLIFIDEIDAVGRQRGVGTGGGNDEREQTLNQMLVEMDGFDKDLGVIVMAATNRPDVLDPALMRPGRFDRQVYVALPDVRGREAILSVHLRKVPVGQDVRTDIVARGTPGFSGADLANLVNEAALFAARRNVRVVEMADVEKAKDKITMGPERKSMVLSEEERRNTAYHEAGHALVARLLPKTDPVHKVTIIPRGRALGVTMQLPEGDRYSTDKERLENTIAILYGGRIAEELFMSQATTGASNDFERATQIARNMVTRWGYSKVLGPMVLAANETDPHAASFVSPDTLREVDREIRELLNAQYARVQVLLAEHADKMHALAGALLDWETIDAEQIDDVMACRAIRQPKAAVMSGRPPALPPAGTPGATPAAVTA